MPRHCALGDAAASTGANNPLYYNSTTGGLYYDADANGSGAAIMIGSVTPGSALTTKNFTVV